MDKKDVIKFLQKAGIWVKDGRIAKSNVKKAVDMIGKAKAGHVSIKVKPGEKVKCINDKKYTRQYGSGSDWAVPSGVKEGETYTVIDIAEDYFGANKLILDVEGKRVVVDTLYMNGMNYGQRFESVDNPEKDVSNVI